MATIAAKKVSVGGIWNGVIAYVIWGLSPLYWKQLDDVPAVQLIAHRIGWSVPLLYLVLGLTGQLSALFDAVKHRRTMAIYVLSAVLLGVSYWICVWAVNAGFIVDLGLGMYINPLVSVLLGVVFCHETLHHRQWVAIGFATIGMLVMAIDYGKFPWIAISIAIDFGLYGLVQKKAPLNALQGVTIEFTLLTIPLVVYLIVMDQNGTGAFGHLGWSKDLLMIGLGLLTVVPQVMFASSAQSVPLSILGLLQFVGPTISVLLGVFVYGEAFGTVKAVAFSLVWLGLILFTFQSYQQSKERRIEWPITPCEIDLSVRASAASYIADDVYCKCVSHVSSTVV